MIRSDQKLTNLTALINKGNNILICQAIEFLREELPFEGAIGLLVSHYDSTEDASTRKSIEGFLNDLKDQTACAEVINEVRKQWKSDTISMLVSSCWQSGLNYAEYSTDLANVFLKGDYITAVECLTVIEESVQDMTIEEKNNIIRLIEENPFSQDSDKRLLTSELIAILNR
jgi:hypothetical protein